MDWANHWILVSQSTTSVPTKCGVQLTEYVDNPPLLRQSHLQYYKNFIICCFHFYLLRDKTDNNHEDRWNYRYYLPIGFFGRWFLYFILLFWFCRNWSCLQQCSCHNGIHPIVRSIHSFVKSSGLRCSFPKT